MDFAFDEDQELFRTTIRQWVDELEKSHPKVRDNLFASLKNVRTTHLLDARLIPNAVPTE